MTEENKIKEVTTYKFERNTTYSNGEQYTDVKIFTEDAIDGCYSVGWEEVANAFLCWLGSVYHYDVRGQVTLPMDRPTMEEVQQWYQNQEFPRTMSSAQAAQDCAGCAY